MSIHLVYIYFGFNNILEGFVHKVFFVWITIAIIEPMIEWLPLFGPGIIKRMFLKCKAKNSKLCQIQANKYISYITHIQNIYTSNDGDSSEVWISRISLLLHLLQFPCLSSWIYIYNDGSIYWLLG